MRSVYRFVSALATVLTLLLLAPLSAVAAADAFGAAAPGSASVLGVLLGIGLALGATLTGAPRLAGKVFRPGQWGSFLRAARESDLSARDLQRLAEAGAVDLDGADPAELLAGGDDDGDDSGEGKGGAGKNEPGAGENGPDALEGIDFTQTSVRKKAVGQDLVAADFEGYEASSEQGFTSGDVDTVVSGKDED